MEMKQLEYFLSVAKTENLTHSAKELGIAQPTLSRSIAQLESELGTRLFDCLGHNRIVLNRNGATFRHRIINARKILHEGIVATKDASHADRGSLYILVTSSQLLAPYLLQHAHRHPNVRIVLQTLPFEHIQTALNELTADFALTYAPIQTDDFFWHSLVCQELYVVVAAEHPLANRKVVSLDDLHTYHLVSALEPQNLELVLRDYLHGSDHLQNFSYFGADPALLNRLVLDHKHVVLLPGYMKDHLEPDAIPFHFQRPKIQLLPLAEHQCLASYGVITHKDRPLSSHAQNFLAGLSNYISYGASDILHNFPCWNEL